MCVYFRECVYMCANVWMPGVDIGCVPPTHSTRDIETGRAHYACSAFQGSLHLPRVSELTTPAQRFSTLRGSNLQSLPLYSKSFTHFWNLLVVLMLYSF